MADPDRLIPSAFLLFAAAAFLLPTGPAYALVFYLAVLPALGRKAFFFEKKKQKTFVSLVRDSTDKSFLLLFFKKESLPFFLIAWSALTLLWGHDDGHRSARFALDSAMTLAFLAAMPTALRNPRPLATTLIWTGTANALLSTALGLLINHHTERLHGWGATAHPILGASVMGIPYLAAIARALAERPWRIPHLLAALAMAVFIAMTESRGPILALGTATLLICAAGPWRWRVLAILAALAAAWRLLPATIRHHNAAVLASRGSSHRFEIWHRTLELIAQRPLFGHGLAANLDLPGITFPHDLYLSVLFYSGAIGGILFAALATLTTWQLWQTRALRDAIWLWTAGAWIAALIAGLTDLGQITKGPGPLWFIFWLPVGLAVASKQSFFKKKDQKTIVS